MERDSEDERDLAKRVALLVLAAARAEVAATRRAGRDEVRRFRHGGRRRGRTALCERRPSSVCRTGCSFAAVATSRWTREFVAARFARIRPRSVLPWSPVTSRSSTQRFGKPSSVSPRSSACPSTTSRGSPCSKACSTAPSSPGCRAWSSKYARESSISCS